MKTFTPTVLSLIFFLINSINAQERIFPPQPFENPFIHSDQKKWSPSDGTLCVPEYSSGCDFGDGFNDFAVEEIENYGSGCADLNGTGWSQYLEMGPAILFPGVTHDFIMKTGYADQFATIWVDFNDDDEFTADEIILFDFSMEEPGQFYTASVTIPASATPGLHYMRARTNWIGSCDDPCASYGYGEAEDYFVMIGAAEAGAIEGYVTELEGGTPVEELKSPLMESSPTPPPPGWMVIITSIMFLLVSMSSPVLNQVTIFKIKRLKLRKKSPSLKALN